jgi:hypothetical protein
MKVRTATWSATRDIDCCCAAGVANDPYQSLLAGFLPASDACADRLMA